MLVMRFHMFLQLIAPVEILTTTRDFTSVIAHLTMSSAMLGKVRGLGESLVAYVTLQWFVFCVDSFVNSWEVVSCAS